MRASCQPKSPDCSDSGERRKALSARNDVMHLGALVVKGTDFVGESMVGMVDCSVAEGSAGADISAAEVSTLAPARARVKRATRR